MHTIIVASVTLATFASGLLAGISTDKSLVQLSARQQMGIVAFAAFSRAADLGRGLLWYPLLGIGAPVLTLVAALLQIFARSPTAQMVPTALAAGMGVAHLYTTSRAAPLLLGVRQSIHDEASLYALYHRFAAWHAARCVLQIATFVLLLWSMLALHA